MAEGDTVLRAARRISEALSGQVVSVTAPNPRGRATGVARLDGRVLSTAEARGKNLLLDFEGLILHSHLGMSGSWHIYRRGEHWRRPRRSAWAVLGGERADAVQWGGPTLRVLRSDQLHRDPGLARLGPDVLAPGFEVATAVRRMRGDDPRRELGEALLDQGLLAGVGNIFKSEACFAATVNPWRRLGEVPDSELGEVIAVARGLMQESVRLGRPPARAYGRAGEPCRTCGGTIRAAGQGDANRTTYWCPGCQSR